MAVGRRYRVDEGGSYGDWEVFNNKTGNTIKVCKTRKAARELAVRKNAR